MTNEKKTSVMSKARYPIGRKGTKVLDSGISMQHTSRLFVDPFIVHAYFPQKCYFQGPLSPKVVALSQRILIFF